jgi:hypothetical protein
MRLSRPSHLIAALSLGISLVAPLWTTSARAEGPTVRLGVARVLAAPSATAPKNAKLKAPKAAGCSTSIPRSSKDRPDLDDGPLVHVIYLIPSDFPDEKLDVNGVLDCSVKAQQNWFVEASGGLRWRFDTFKAKVKDQKTGKTVTREIADVTFVKSARPGGSLATAFDVAEDLEQAGFADSDKRYLSYVASESGACGDAVFPLASPLSGPVPDGKYAQVYLFADKACRSHEFGPPGDAGFAEMIAQQEIIHNDAIVSGGAPHGCAMGTPPGMGHICTGPLVLTEGGENLDPERIDVMYPYVSVPLSEKVLDPGNDDYFNTLLPNLSDLADSPYVEATG